jgi:hypothetical protein
MLRKQEEEVTHCRTCNGINLHWDMHSGEWAAPYVDGALYCDCPTQELEARWDIDIY